MALSIKLKNVDRELDKVSNETRKLINQAQRLSAMAASSELQVTTPIDTGRARGSWMITPFKGNFRDAINGGLAPLPMLGPVPSDKIETLYITNGTPYIQDLNRGSSQQAPPRFIEKTLSKYFQIKPSSIRAT